MSDFHGIFCFAQCFKNCGAEATSRFWERGEYLFAPDKGAAICWGLVELRIVIHFSELVLVFETFWNKLIYISVYGRIVKSIGPIATQAYTVSLADMLPILGEDLLSICFQDYRSEDHVITSF